MTLAKDAITKHPLIAHISDCALEGSSTSVSSGDSMLCLGYSSSSNDQVIRDINFNGVLKEKDIFGSKEILSKFFLHNSSEGEFPI